MVALYWLKPAAKVINLRVPDRIPGINLIIFYQHAPSLDASDHPGLIRDTFCL